MRHEAAHAEEKEPDPIEVPRLRQVLIERFINPPAYISEQRRKLQEEREKPKRTPAEPERDVMLFLLQNAPLESWERDVLDIVREEAYYFARSSAQFRKPFSGSRDVLPNSQEVLPKVRRA